MVFENSNIEIITTRQIFNIFLEKYALICGLSKEFLGKILKFRPVSIGA